MNLGEEFGDHLLACQELNPGSRIPPTRRDEIETVKG